MVPTIFVSLWVRGNEPANWADFCDNNVARKTNYARYEEDEIIRKSICEYDHIII